jgi:hypothetical protein
VIKEFLKKVSCKGMIDSFIVNKNQVAIKSDDGIICAFVSTEKELFKNEFGLINVSDLLKIVDTLQDECSEEDNRLIFKSDKSQLKWLKADVKVLQTLNKTREDLVKIYSENKLEIKISKEITDTILKTINTNISDKIRFFVKDGNLVISVGEEYQNKFESVLMKLDKDVKINNSYKSLILKNVLDTIDFNGVIVLEYGLFGDSDKAFPLLIDGKTESGINVTYFIAPIIEG